MYTKGIECYPSQVLFQNRAMAYLKLEQWQNAVCDCDSAIAIDANATKVSYPKT